MATHTVLKLVTPLDERDSGNIETLAKYVRTDEADVSYAERGFSILLDQLKLMERPTTESTFLRVVLNLTIIYPIVWWLLTLVVCKLVPGLIANWPDADRWLLLKRGPNRISPFDCTALGYDVRAGVQNSRALGAIYAQPVMKFHWWNPADWLNRVWFAMDEAKAVRNRLRITYEELLQEMERVYDRYDKVRVLSIACGSADATILALAAFKRRHPGADVKLHLVDLNPASIRRASSLANSRNLGDCVVAHEMNIKDFFTKKEFREQGWDIIEMVGFLDYRGTESLIRYCKEIRAMLKPGGLFIGAHILPSKWSWIVRWWIGWPGLIRRTPEHYWALLLTAGFADREIKLKNEPCGIYVVNLCRRAEH